MTDDGRRWSSHDDELIIVVLGRSLYGELLLSNEYKKITWPFVLLATVKASKVTTMNRFGAALLHFRTTSQQY